MENNHIFYSLLLMITSFYSCTKELKESTKELKKNEKLQKNKRKVQKL